jgi:ubiquinol-cytochrome c reductase cytochrome b subunit
MLKKLREWVAVRFAAGPIQEHILDRRVPRSPWYFGDGAALFLLLSVLIATGALMSLTYSPSPEHAYESVRHITFEQTLGWFIRGLHYWSAGMMMVMIVFHLFRQILVGGYKAPREGTWLIGVIIFFLVWVMGFTGYVLRWDERGIYAIRVALNLFHAVPVIGPWLVELIQGGPVVGSRTLTRIFGVHAIIVPILLLLPLVAFHLYLVITRGTTSVTERKIPVKTAEQQKKVYDEDKVSEERGETFHPRTTAQSLTFALVVFAIVVTLTLVYGPGQLYPAANLTRASFPVEEWWWSWYSGLLALTPPLIQPILLVGLPIVLFVVLMALPFVDRGPARGIRNRPIAAVIVAVLAIGLVYLSDLRRRSPWTGWPDPTPPPVPADVALSPNAEQGRQLFAQFGCNSCHAIAGHGREIGPDLARLDARYSQEELRQWILHPPPDVPMPSYNGRLTQEQLDLIVDFVLVAQTFPREQ